MDYSSYQFCFDETESPKFKIADAGWPENRIINGCAFSKRNSKADEMEWIQIKLWQCISNLWKFDVSFQFLSRSLGGKIEGRINNTINSANFKM